MSEIKINDGYASCSCLFAMTNVNVGDDCYLQQQQDVMVTLSRVKHPQEKGQIERKESTNQRTTCTIT